MTGNRGRPRSFDSEKTLEQTLGLFWHRGYLGTSYTDLCAETGLTKPSLYAAYGNKEKTFLTALDLYVSRYVQPGIDSLDREANAREAIRLLLVATVEGLTAEGTPPGCMIATNAACIARHSSGCCPCNKGGGEKDAKCDRCPFEQSAGGRAAATRYKRRSIDHVLWHSDFGSVWSCQTRHAAERINASHRYGDVGLAVIRT